MNDRKSQDIPERHEEPTPTPNEKVLADFVKELEAVGAERIDLERWVREHPDLEEDFRGFQQSIENLDQSRPAYETPIPKRLGEFRIVRMLAQGGMGEVYLAEQESLNRMVAVKTVRRARVSPKDKLRFLREQKVLASLHQRHIVPIHTAGEQQELQYFAMPYIEGATLQRILQIADDLTHSDPSLSAPPLGRLAALAMSDSTAKTLGVAVSETTKIAAEPDNAPELAQDILTEEEAPEKPKTITLSNQYYRSAARVLADVAEAVHHAHDAGILHRDLKPSNIMVDENEQCWVIDFGLAGHRDVELDGQKPTPHPSTQPLTQTGRYLGTPAYMAPEQFTGSTDVRTDVWGLGVTMYELLTAQRAFGGPDYSGIGHQIRHGKVTRPRLIVRSVPRDLESICLNALQRNPETRYQSLQAMADDLRRWLRAEPVQARSASIPYRAQRFAQRHIGLITAAVVVLLLGLGGLAVGTALLWHEKEQTTAALEESERQRGAAERSFRRSQEAVERFLERVGSSRLANVPQMEHLRRDLMSDALEFQQQFLNQRGSDPIVRRQAARAYRSLADIHRILGQHLEAKRALTKSVNGLQELVAEFPDSVDLKNDLAVSYNSLGELLRRDGQWSEAEDSWVSARELWTLLSDERPTQAIYQSQLAGVIHNIALRRYTEGHFVDARELYQQAIDLQNAAVRSDPENDSYRDYLSRHYLNLGSALWQLKDIPATEDAYRQSLQIRSDLVAKHPDDADHLERLSMILESFAMFLTATDQKREAGELLDRAVEVGEKLADDYPFVPDYRNQVGSLLCGRAERALDIGQANKARELLAEAIKQQERTVENNPHRADYYLTLGRQYAILGKVLEALGLDTDALTALRKSLSVQTKFFSDHPNQERFALTVADSRYELGRLLDRMQRFQEAEAEYLGTIALQESMVEQFPQVNDFRFGLAESYNALGNLKMAIGQMQESFEHLRKARQLAEELADEFSKDPYSKWFLSIVCFNLANLSDQSGKSDLAVEFHQEAIELREELVNAGENRKKYLAALGESYNNLADVLARAERFQESEKLHHKSLQVRQTLSVQFPDDESYAAEVGHTFNNLGIAQSMDGRNAEAAKTFHQALTVFEELQVKFPSSLDHRDDTANSSANLAIALKELGQFAEAETRLLKAIAILTPLVQQVPQSRRYRGTLNRAVGTLNDLYTAGGRPAEALRLLEKIRGIQESLEAKCPDDRWFKEDLAETYNRLSWIMTTGADQSLRDIDRGLELAQKAIQLSPQPHFWHTLAVAQYRSGDWNAAVETLKKSMNTEHGNDSVDMFFMAMSCWQLGNYERAREWYEKGVAWCEANATDDKEMLRFQTEANKLIEAKMDTEVERAAAANNKRADG